MRVSTSQIFDAGTRNLIDGQSALYKTQNQLSTGRRVLTPDDDPVAAAQVLLTSQARDVNAMYADNQKNASSQLALAEDRLKSVVDSIQFIQEEVVAGGNASYSDAQRMYIAKSLQGHSYLGLHYRHYIFRCRYRIYPGCLIQCILRKQ